ncbi:hypothetical protein RIF29_12916 [Crotalaria pallida]|uniref:BZIP domain-containing protein n=1 Tax=Crotalaria pallida TaxID=3830 RepID=A0AAN9P1N5_CROPI
MKQCTMLTPLENEVVEILAEFRTIRLSNLDSGFQFSLGWGRKGLRSAISAATPSSSPSLPPSKAAEASSPATPLSFSPSESEEKRTLLRKNVSLKRKRDHYLKTIEDLTKDNDLLNGEVKNVRSHLEKLKDFNLKLKARKHELSLRHEPQPILFPPPLIHDQMVKPIQISDDAVSVAIAQPQVQQQERLSFGMPSLSSSSNPNGLGSNSNVVGPIGIPDLNLLPVEEEPMTVECGEMSEANQNLSRAIAAAQTRQKRIEICKVKNLVANNKMQHSCSR